MVKGLARSISRGGALQQAVTKLTIPLVNAPVSIVAVSSAIGFGTFVAAGLPQAHLKIMAVAIDIILAGSGADANLVDTWEGDFAVGTTPMSDATISTGDEDLITETATGAATDEVSPRVVVADGVDLVLDNTAGDLEVNLNVLVDAADITDDETVVLTATGVIEITFITMLDD